MWNDYTEVDGIMVAMTDACYPFIFHRNEKWATEFKRPQIALTRATVHKLADSGMNRTEIIEWLYRCVKISEQTQTIIDKQERRSFGDFAHIPYKLKPGYVYFMWCAEKSIMKIGCSGDPKKRLKSVQRDIGAELKILGVIATTGMYELESEMHSLFSCRRHDGEWFRIEPKHLKVAQRYLDNKKAKAA